MLSKLNGLATEHFFQKQVEFKATHLQRLVGAEFEDSYRGRLLNRLKKWMLRRGLCGGSEPNEAVAGAA